MTHLSPEALAGYLDDDLSGAERSDAELHLATCGTCREELAEVRRLQQRRGSRRWVIAAVPAAAAAGLVLVLFRPSAPSPVRADPAAEMPLPIVSPASTDVDPAPVAFIWRSLGAEAAYTFTLQEADGRVVLSLPLSDTAVTLADSVMDQGRTYFWFVDGMLPDGRSRSTALHRLQTRP